MINKFLTHSRNELQEVGEQLQGAPGPPFRMWKGDTVPDPP